jgi:putative transcriptional regulator
MTDIIKASVKRERRLNMNGLRNFRSTIGISQYNMARKMDVSMSFYEKIERGHAKASRGFMCKLKEAFPKANIDEIFFAETEASKNEQPT